MKNVLNQISFLNFDEETTVRTNVKSKKKKANTEKKPQLSIFELITGFLDKEKKETIENPVKKSSSNYNLSERVIEGLGSIKQRIAKNLTAIKLVKKLKAQNSFANFMEQDVLVKFTGFGAMQELFDNSAEKYSDGREELKILLTPEEYKSAEATVNNAFYTDTKIINFMYKALEKLGFKGGDILEPSCGIGNFFGAMPNEIKNSSTLKGVELDTLTGEIAKQLYQQADIEINPFEESLTYTNYYDLIIGNVPFGNYGVFDKDYNKYNLSIHNYFIVKALDKLRTGGLLAVVTSKFTMDSKNNKHRELIKDKAKVVACFRLPRGAFSEYARTDAVTDIIILQKTGYVANDKDTNLFLSIDNRGINRYYTKHPENILGTLEEKSCMFGKELVPILKDKTIEEAFVEALQSIPENIYTAFSGVKDKYLPANNFDIKPYGYDFINGKLVQNQNGVLVEIDKVKNKNNLEMYKDFVELKKHVHKVLQEQVRKCSDETLKELQEQLNVMYDRFVYKYQYIDSKACKNKFKEDPDYPLLCALEVHTKDGIKKADIFYKRTIKNELLMKNIETAKDALSYSVNKYGYVNIDFIKNIYSSTEEEILEELKGIIFLNPLTNTYELSSEYLSGNVKEKLETAKKAAETDDKFKENVLALEKVQPIPLTYDQIEVKLGTTFIPVDYYTKFIRYLLNTTGWQEEHVYVDYINKLDEYKVYGNSFSNYSDNHQKWGTDRKSACELVGLSLNNRSAKVFDTILNDEGKERRVLNKEETINAEMKQQLIKEEFKKWIYEDKERRETIEQIYNYKFNSFVDKKYIGSLLTLPGKNPNIEFRDYQKNVVSRAIIENNSLLLFHHLGSGKSFEMMAIGMEMVRFGICNKPLYVVPNHMVQSGQFYREFLELYPNAKILAATSEDFAKDKRMKLVSKIATCEWDAVIIGHSSLVKIPVSKEFQINLLNQQMQEIKEAIKDNDADDKMTIKRYQTILKNQELKLKKLKNINQDNTIIFEELGIDQLFIDEAHNFKNLYVFSKMSNVAGVQNTSAQKTEDLYAKIQYIYKCREEGKGVVFATGTPVSNSMSELYVMQKYLQPQILRKHGIDTFDRWASVFGEVINSVEISPTGKGFKQKQRFAKFYNVPELTSIFRQCSDILLKHQLNIPTPKPNYHKIEIPAITAVTNYINNELLPRAEAIANKEVPPEVDNMLKVTNDGRKAALDIRLIDSNIEIDGPTKITVCAETVYKVWEKTKTTKGTQLIFCDLGTPKTSSNVISEIKQENDDTDVLSMDETDLFDDTFFDVYHEIQKILLEKGVPNEEIAFIHDAKTPAQRVNMISAFKKGELRILLGSTSKMGEGMNAMNKIVAIHHIDVPWKPSSLDQRDGRGIRFGNENKEIDIYRYVTKGTFDAFSWQTVQTKANFIGQILCGMSNERNIDDVDVQLMNFAEMKAAASDNPLILRKFELEVQFKKLNILEKNFIKNKYSIQSKILKLENQMPLLEKNLINIKKDAKIIKNADIKTIIIDGEEKELNLELIETITPKINILLNNEEIYIGEYLGLKMIGSVVDLGKGIRSYIIILQGEAKYKINYETQLSLLRQLGAFKEKLINKKMPYLENSLYDNISELEKLKEEYNKTFPQHNDLVLVKNELQEVNAELKI